MAVLIVAISFQSLEQEKESIGLFENVIFCRFSVLRNHGLVAQFSRSSIQDIHRQEYNHGDRRDNDSRVKRQSEMKQFDRCSDSALRTVLLQLTVMSSDSLERWYVTEFVLAISSSFGTPGFNKDSLGDARLACVFAWVP